MDNFLARFGPDQIAVDLGCGRGSFHYESYGCRVVGIDLNLDPRHLYRDGNRIGYVCAESGKTPLASKSVDAVICHHTLEHFPDYRGALQETNRVLKDSGVLWIAVPNGYGFDDALYRWVFSGGGHVNRFSRDALIQSVHELTRFRLQQEVDLFSSFIYLKRPTLEEYQYYPRSARALFHIPESVSIGGILAINAVTRVIDKIFHCRWSQYGWGFVFAEESVNLPPLHTAYFNVCSRCGSGLAAVDLRKRGVSKTIFGVGLYHCPNCNQTNSFVEPPAGLV